MKQLILIVTGIAGASILAAQTIPPDAKSSCPVAPATFNSWFVTGVPSLNGIVNPANSVTFPSIPNCSFYAWSKQMFLWLTSPAPVTYGGGGGRVFDSPVFYDVSPPDSHFQRTFIPHTPGFIRVVGVRIPPAGPHGLPIVFDKTGRMLEVQPQQLTQAGNPLIQDRAGNLAEVARVTLAPNRKVVFQDITGKTIQPLLAPAVKPAAKTVNTTAISTIAVRKFIVGGIPIFVDSSGNVIDVEQGQSDGGVLETQNGSLIYYATMVNDVYAYFLTGMKDGAIMPPPTQFPTTQANLNAIKTFASAHGKTFPDEVALAIEVKSSWVEAAGLPNASSYITMTATIPTYDKTNPAQWVANGQKTTQLALVGMHVVGSTAQHPEMVWATFEHFSNSPNASYSYTNAGNATIQVPQTTAGNWLVSAAGSGGPFNNMHMFTSGADIAANTPNFPTINASDTARWRPWGMPGSSTSSNTEVISIHNSVNSMMPVGDIRNNYFMTGATWTIPGNAPPAAQVGTNQLANSTMETYEQASCTSGSQNPCTAFAQGSNCFSCHVTFTPANLSHVFGGANTGLKPLF
jgi:hypothetical protein